MKQHRLVVADDDDAFRAALVDVLSADRRFDVVAELSEAFVLADAVAASRPDVVLMDVRMPGGGVPAATALLQRRRELGTGPAVVAMSAHASPTIVASMVRAGAVGYLAKGRLGTGVGDLVARCAAGEVVLAVPSAVEALRRLSRPDPVAGAEAPATPARPVLLG